MLALSLQDTQIQLRPSSIRCGSHTQQPPGLSDKLNLLEREHQPCYLHNVGAKFDDRPVTRRGAAR
jgi:hypothetical protein